jgi:hypothetical protein
MSASLVVIQNQLCHLCPSWPSKQVIVFTRGVGKTKKVRKAVSLAIEMEIIKRAEGGQQSKDMHGDEFFVYKNSY